MNEREPPLAGMTTSAAKLEPTPRTLNPASERAAPNDLSELGDTKASILVLVGVYNTVLVYFVLRSYSVL